MNPNLTAWRSVPSDWFHFQWIYDLAVDTAPRGSILVESGSFWGASALYLAEAAAQANKDLRCYAIDSWSMSPRPQDLTYNDGLFNPAHARAGHIEPIVHAQHHNSTFETFARFLDGHYPRLSPEPLRVMRMDSLEAIDFFEALHPKSTRPIWMVLLDDDHEYAHVKEQLRRWVPLIRSGGIIGGDNYEPEFQGVIDAVNEFFGTRAEIRSGGKSNGNVTCMARV
jgi:cephalosporin hydroxylase